MGKPEEKCPLRVPRCRREDNIKMNLGKWDRIGWNSPDSYDSEKNQWRDGMKTVMDLRVA
jgi:hypothetical protein